VWLEEARRRRPQADLDELVDPAPSPRGELLAAEQMRLFGAALGRLSEALQVIRSLWTQQATTFEGRYYHLHDAVFNPKPLQTPHPPIWIGAGGETTLRLVAKYADVWNAIFAEPDETRRMIETLGAACAAIGRDPSEIRRSFQLRWDGESTDEVIETSGSMAELGFTEQVVYLAGGHVARTAEKLANLLPELRRAQRVAP